MNNKSALLQVNDSLPIFDLQEHLRILAGHWGHSASLRVIFLATRVYEAVIMRANGGKPANRQVAGGNAVQKPVATLRSRVRLNGGKLCQMRLP